MLLQLAPGAPSLAHLPKNTFVEMPDGALVFRSHVSDQIAWGSDVPTLRSHLVYVAIRHEERLSTEKGQWRPTR
jgi:hypothetical protein